MSNKIRAVGTNRVTAASAIKMLKARADPECFEGMKRFGISTSDALGVHIPAIRETAKAVGKDHKMALELWKSGIKEARILASMVDVPELVTESQMESWVRDFNSWDLCDQCCGNLFDRTEFAYKKAREWSKRKQEYVKRAGFVLMAALAVHSKKMSDSSFTSFLPIIERESYDERNFVKKAVNWALRQIGKRNRYLNRRAVSSARRIRAQGSKSARWIASDAIRELESEAVGRSLNG